MKVYYENNGGDEPIRSFIGEGKLESEVDYIINKDIEDRKINCYYLRYMYKPNNEIYVDYGSRVNFYVIAPSEEEEEDEAEIVLL